MAKYLDDSPTTATWLGVIEEAVEVFVEMLVSIQECFGKFSLRVSYFLLTVSAFEAFVGIYLCFTYNIELLKYIGIGLQILCLLYGIQIFIDILPCKKEKPICCWKCIENTVDKIRSEPVTEVMRHIGSIGSEGASHSSTTYGE